MQQNIKVERANPDGLSKQVWSFWLVDNLIVLDSYSFYKRESKRHGWKSHGRYDRLDNRGSKLELDQVDLPEDVAKEALETYIAKLKVVREYNLYR